MSLSVPNVHGGTTEFNGHGPIHPLLYSLPAATARGPAQLQQQALSRLAARAGDAIALMVSLPFCAVHCLCCERDVRAGQTPEAMRAYVRHVGLEIDQLAGQIGGSREIMQLHLGGGSANLFGASCLVSLMHGLRQHWRLPCDAELSVECDPRSVGWVQLELLRRLGFDEVHFGVFDLDVRVQQAIGRLHSAALIDDACSLARQCGITSVRLSLMVGLPGQSLASWRETLHQVIAIAPARITLARYWHRPGQVTGQYAIDAHALPGPAEVLDLLALSAQELCAVGYRWIGADLFVLDDDPLALAQDEGRLRVSLLGHTAQPAMPQLGVGRGAVGELDGCMVWNHPAPQAWQTDVAQGRLPVARAWQADEPARQRRAAAEHLLCRQQLPAAMLPGALAPLYESMAQQAPHGSLDRRGDCLVVTAAGRTQLQRLCADLAGVPPQMRQPMPAWLN